MSHKDPNEGVIFADGTRPTSRATEIVVGAIVGVLGGLVVIGTHRMRSTVQDVSVPWGLLFGCAYEVVATCMLVALSGRKLPLFIDALAFTLVAVYFSGTSLGGGLLVPAQIAGEAQWQGWAAQFLGVIVPLVGVAIVWAIQIRNIARANQREERTVKL
ncbi:hypothetical protein M3C92_03995 [Dermabacter hominis]|uniref:hypothetical protein n=1 Tax=Dermabacter hominis TaxID=36740 RepID=UPI0021A4FC9C|nr:hypothetical protein [Dermabacter hominis]MCT1955385.1 hypothetical protein [Dermabacter hominis]